MGESDWDPLNELAKVQRRLNELFDAAIGRTDYRPQKEAGGWVPAADVYETEERWTATVELPGVLAEAIEVRIEGDELVIEGERKMDPEEEAVEAYHRVERNHGRFHRRLRLPLEAGRGEASATYRDGLLTVSVDKTAARRASVRIPVR